MSDRNSVYVSSRPASEPLGDFMVTPRVLVLSCMAIAVGLLSTIFVALPGAQALAALSVAPARHPAGCHSHGPGTPTHAPASYQCCVSGHDVAIPNPAFSSRRLAARICAMSDALGLRPDFPHDRISVLFVVSSNSPPGAVPLRI